MPNNKRTPPLLFKKVNTLLTLLVLFYSSTDAQCAHTSGCFSLLPTVLLYVQQREHLSPSGGNTVTESSGKSSLTKVPFPPFTSSTWDSMNKPVILLPQILQNHTFRRHRITVLWHLRKHESISHYANSSAFFTASRISWIRSHV